MIAATAFQVNALDLSPEYEAETRSLRLRLTSIWTHYLAQWMMPLKRHPKLIINRHKKSWLWVDYTKISTLCCGGKFEAYEIVRCLAIWQIKMGWKCFSDIIDYLEKNIVNKPPRFETHKYTPSRCIVLTNTTSFYKKVINATKIRSCSN